MGGACRSSHQLKFPLKSVTSVGRGGAQNKLRRAQSCEGVERHSALKSDERYNRMTDRNKQNAQEGALARLIVETLNLEVPPSEIDPEAPLYGEGLGLDSIDILEIAVAVSKEFGVKLRADDKNNRQIFSSLRSLNGCIQLHRAG
jgi:acyl carrier protein